jgi:hypothetical protein
MWIREENVITQASRSITTMINPFINWCTDSAGGFFVNISGSLTAAGNVWSGVAVSPTGRWKLSFDPGSRVIQNISPPHFNYDLTMATVSAIQNFGPARTYQIYASGFGVSSWGSDLTPPPAPPSSTPPYLPRLWGWSFKFDNGSGQPAPAWWSGLYRITLTWTSKPADLATWRYDVDVVVNCPARRVVLPAVPIRKRKKSVR